MIFISNAVGGVYNLFFIAVFMVIVSGYIAFSVSYNKAYKVKNKIINSIEECEGNEDCFNDKVKKYIKQVEYHASRNWNGQEIMKKKGFSNAQCPSNLGYCYAEQKLDSSCTKELGGCKSTFTVTTSVTIEVPVMSTFVDINNTMFTVSGVTSAITIKE